jgi:hypothetical protein
MYTRKSITNTTRAAPKAPLCYVSRETFFMYTIYMKSIYKFLIGFVLLAVIIMIGYFFSLRGINNIRSHRAITVGHKYLTEVYSDYALAGEHCQGVDTDGDNYVSCDFRLIKGDIERVVNLQCPTIRKSLIGSSCKESRLPINN